MTITAYTKTQSDNSFLKHVGPSNGTDDTAHINALLAGGGKIVGQPGQTYLTSAPLVIPSSTTLDMTGCTVQLKTGSNCNMLNNTAVAAVVRVLNAVMTSGSAVLTDSTGSFTAGMVGKAVTVQGAGAAGAPLTTTVASYQSATQITLSATAGTSVTGQYAAVGPRDSRIKIVGGVWDRQNNNSVPSNTYNSNSLRFRHVDGLTVDGASFLSTGGKYQLNPADCTRVNIGNLQLPNASSDGVHFNGPCSGVTVHNILGGTMGDDLVSFTARDSTAGITDCAGDITDVMVENVHCAAATAGLFTSGLKIVAGQTTDGSASYAVRRMTATRITSPTLTAAVVFLGDSSGGIFDDITVDGVRSLGGSSRGCVDIHGGTSLDRITLRNLTPDPADSWAVGVSASVDRLDVSGLKITATTGGPNGVLVVPGVTVNRLLIDKVQTNAPSGSALRVSGTVGQAELSNIQQEGGATAVTVPAGGALGSVVIHGLASSGAANPLGTYFTTTTLAASGANCTGTGGNWVAGSGAGQVTITGLSGLSGDAFAFASGSGVFLAPTSAATDPDTLTVGETSMRREYAQGTPQLSTGNMVLTYFTARKTETVNNVQVVVGGTAAAGTTIARYGIYTVDATGNLTLVASTANDTTLWNGTFAAPSRALSASWSKVAGQRYALGVLFVGTTGPKLSGFAAANSGAMALAPRLNGNVTGLSDLPSTVTGGTVAATQGISVYASLT